MINKPKKKKVSLSKLMIKADGVFSKYIRNRDALKTTGTLDQVHCISCRVVYLNEGHKVNCGHYVPRYCKSLRYDEENCNSQCVACNKYLSGNLFCYEEGILDRYGLKTLTRLKESFRDYRMNGYKFTEKELRGIIEKYTKLNKDLIKSDQDISINDLQCDF